MSQSKIAAQSIINGLKIVDFLHIMGPTVAEFEAFRKGGEDQLVSTDANCLRGTCEVYPTVHTFLMKTSSGYEGQLIFQDTGGNRGTDYFMRLLFSEADIVKAIGPASEEQERIEELEARLSWMTADRDRFIALWKREKEQRQAESSLMDELVKRELAAMEVA